jgi:glycosyltransferase involved in cell wall biosynthesis
MAKDWRKRFLFGKIWKRKLELRMKKIKISAAIIAKDEEKMIEDCLKSLAWVDEIVLIDSGSTDRTCDIADKYTAKIIKVKGGNYSDWRNEGLVNARGEWILYVDADERITPLLRKEIESLITNQQSEFNAYAIPRRNVILGKEMKHGGWWPDYVKRLYKKDKLEKWSGELHEEPVFTGNLDHLKNPMIHIKHSDLSQMVEKTNKWSEVEARLLYEANHPKMVWWRFIRIILTELWLRLIKLKGILDGVEGIIYSFYQAWSKFITYAKLWELQLENSKANLKIETNKIKL